MPRLKAVFRFRASDDREFMLSPIKVLMRAWRILKTHDPAATLKITPDDDEPPVHFDRDGD